MGYKFNPFIGNFDRVSGSGAPPVELIQGDSGGPVGPDAAYTVNLLGNPDIEVAGDPGTSTLQLTNLSAWSKYVVDPTAGNSRFQTVQAALDQADSDGGGTVVLHPGTYTEDLTLYANVDIWGAVGVADTGVCKIIGTHTPPATGSLTIRNVFLESATDIFNSAVAGTGDLILIDCAIDVTNGYTFNLLNWTGGFACFDIGEIGSTNDGWVNNTGGATVFMTNITMGAGSANSMITSGFVELYNCVVQCPVDFQTGTTGLAAGGSVFKENVTFSNNATMEIANCYFTTGAVQAITYNSSGNSSLTDCTINSSNSPAIGGTGAGTLALGSISYLSNSVIAGTVTTSSGVIQSGEAFLNNISFDEGSSTLSSNGQLWIGSSGGNPAPATITAGTGITVTNAANYIRLDASTATPLSFPTDSGTATPAANALSVLGGTGINTSASGSTLTINLDDPVVVANGGSGRTSATAYAVICGGTDSTNPHQSIASVGTSGQVLTSNGAGALPTFEDASAGGGYTLGTLQATTSGTSFNFSGIPSGTTQIVVNFNQVGFVTAGANFQIQIGDAGGIENTGYESMAGNSSGSSASTSAFLLTRSASNSFVHSGSITLTLIDAATFLWAACGMLTGGTTLSYSAGAKALSAELTQLTMSTTNGSAFDAGSINIAYI